MKKTLCWLITIAMLIAMAPSVFAAEVDERNNVTLNDAGEVQTVTLAQETATVPASFWGIGFEYEAPADGTATIVIGDDHPENTTVEYGYRSNDENGNYFKTYKDGYTQTIDVAAGETIEVDLCLIVMNADGSEGAYTGGQASFTLTFTGVLPEGWVGEEEDPEEPAEDTVLELGDNALSIASGIASSPEYTFTATETGTLTMIVNALTSTTPNDSADWTADLEEFFPLTMSVNDEVVEGRSASLEVTEGDVVTVMLTQNRMYVNGSYSWEATLNLAFEAGSEEPEVPEVPAEGDMVLGNNTLTAASGNQSEHTFVATETGTLYITIRNWAMNGIEYGDQMLDYGWSKILVNDTAMSAMTDTMEVTAGDAITFVITSDGDTYVSNVYLSMEGFYEEPVGSEFNPIQLDPADLPTNSIEIPAGEEIWYKLSYNFYDYELRVYGEDAYIVSYYYDYSTGIWPAPLVPTYHYAENGVATYTVEYVVVKIGNAGTETATFQIDGYLPEGLSQNPADLVMGEQTINVAYEQYAYYIEWIAPEDGTLTLVFSGSMWRYNVCNVADPDDWSDDGTDFYGRQLTEGDPDTVVVEVLAGDLVRIDVGCSDENWDLPAGTIIINASFAPAGGEVEPELPEVENPIVIGDNVIELPRGAEEASVYNFVATETGTLYFMATDFKYSASWTEGYQDNNEYMTDWTDYTIFCVNGEEVPGGFYGSVEVVAGEVYTFTWAHNGSDYGFQATINLSYSDELIPTIGVDIELRPSHLPMDTVEIGAGERVLYTISWEFSGRILRIYGENAYIYYEHYDWWSGEKVTQRIDAVDGIVEYDLDFYGSREFYIGNAGEEAATFSMECYAPEGGEYNPYIVENLEDIYVFAEAGEEFNVYYQWTSDKLGTITVIAQMYNIHFYNMTKDENGEYDSTWTNYSVYVEPGDVLQIVIAGYAMEDMECVVEYTFEEGYRQGSEQNPIEVDLMAGMDVDLYNETIFYTWTPEQSMIITLNFTLKYTWSSNLPTITINGEAYTLGEELAVTAGETVYFSLSTTPSVYGTLQATKVESEEPEVVLGDVNGDGEINYLDAMLVAQFYVGDIDETGLNMAAADVNADGFVNYLDAMLIAQFYVGDIVSFEP